MNWLTNPVPWGTLFLSEVSSHRLDECPFYEKCLSKAERENWPGFTCTLCRVFIEEKERYSSGKESAFTPEVMKLIKKVLL